MKDANFLPTIVSAWDCRIWNSDPSEVISVKLKRTQRSIKSWKKNRPNLWQQETDCRIVTNLMDYVEETRPLSPQESNLRSLIVKILDRVTQAKLLLWKQRSKVKAAIEGDENTRYFHACTNQRLRKNKIQVLEHDGCDVFNHDSKAAVLHSFYRDLLGTSVDTSWEFCLDDMYHEGSPLDVLDAEFNEEEIYTAFRRMHINASPRPDGFGPLFLKAIWRTGVGDVRSLFAAFHANATNIKRLNRSYLVLPKKENARRPQDFRPIAL